VGEVLQDLPWLAQGLILVRKKKILVRQIEYIRRMITIIAKKKDDNNYFRILIKKQIT